jgi:hypothetical protein
MSATAGRPSAAVQRSVSEAIVSATDADVTV